MLIRLLQTPGGLDTRKALQLEKLPILEKSLDQREKGLNVFSSLDYPEKIFR